MLGLGCVIALVVGCGGSEFSADGETGGSDAGADSSGSGGSGGSDAEAGTGGSVDSGPDAPANKCTSELFQQTCQSPLITTGNATCDQCGRDNCCSQTNTCLADQSCAQQLRCYLESCLGQSAFGCVPGQCPACLASTQIFFGVSTCLQTNCSPVCPMLIP
jgi:hypothetical protein